MIVGSDGEGGASDWIHLGCANIEVACNVESAIPPHITVVSNQACTADVLQREVADVDVVGSDSERSRSKSRREVKGLASQDEGILHLGGQHRWRKQSPQ